MWPERTLTEIVRFLVIGGLSTLAYIVGVRILVDGLSLSAALAGAITYLALLPANFIAHRDVTFRSGKGWRGPLPRFLIMHALAALGAAGVLHVMVAIIGIEVSVGAFVVAMLVPIASFIAMRFWVFAKPSDDKNESD